MNLVLGVISDTHHPYFRSTFPWEAVCRHFKGVQVILHAGDLADLAVFDELSLIAPVEAVCGNMDNDAVRRQFPQHKVLDFGSVKIGLIHSFFVPEKGRDPRLYGLFGSDVRVVVFGHTHTPCSRFVDGVLYFNPGSPVKPAPGLKPSLGLLRIDAKGLVESDIVFL